MAIDPVRFAVDQIRRILDSLGWSVIAMDESGNQVTLTIRKSKDQILKP